MSERRTLRSRLATMQAAFSLVGAILRGGRGGGTGDDVERSRREPLGEGFGPTDVYVPVGGHSQRAAVLMVPGLTAHGPDDPRIPGFASTIARGGMAVLVPDLPGMRRRLMRVQDVDDVERAARAVPGWLGVDKTVLLAFSYAAGPTFLAGTRMTPDELAGTVTVGAYWSLDHVLEFTATRTVTDLGGGDLGIPENPAKRLEGQWIFLQSAARWLDDGDDRATIEAAAERWHDDAPPGWDEVRAGLGPEGRAVVDVIRDADPATHRDARERLPGSVVEAMARLDLPGRLDELDTPVVLIHGRNDQRIPYHESLLLRDELADHTVVKLAILRAFVHAQREVGWSRFWRVAGDAARLGRCGFEILGWAV